VVDRHSACFVADLLWLHPGERRGFSAPDARITGPNAREHDPDARRVLRETGGDVDVAPNVAVATAGAAGSGNNS
jgi:hypothetical protein